MCIRDLSNEYFDGTREQGCGGYYDDNRWGPVAEDFIKHYNLQPDAKILDIGCAKGFLLKEFKRLLPAAETCGVDISDYAIENCSPSIIEHVYIANADNLPFKDNYFDLVISINSLHNIMDLDQLSNSFSEINRVSKNSSNAFVSLGAYEMKMREWFSITGQLLRQLTCTLIIGKLFLIRSHILEIT